MITTSVDLAALGASLAPVRMLSPHAPISALGSPAVFVPGFMPIADVVALLEERQAACALVDGGIGIVTERLVVRALAAGSADPSDPVASVAADPPELVDGSTTVAAAAGLMLDDHVRLLVVDGDAGGIRVVAVEEVLEVLLEASGRGPWLPSLRTLFDPVPENWLG